MDNIAAWLHHFQEYTGRLIRVKTAQDIQQAKQLGKVGIIDECTALLHSLVRE